ncbi:flagellar hook-length control protein FliK [Sulfuricystis multivorans]|uniref:flagellar hook-length control protein FliK n=1 Tax=Sulfuricystis multivorans TaxID=2211108 RepID=UPI000F81ADB9|nr:flagellar hook-length control protein FliK [Sulfuricystis multivorans]
MVLVPPDAAIRMRMQTEANLLEPVQPARPIPSELPDLRPGQTFQARILEPLPDNTYRALVAGKQLTLQLTEGAKAGDQLELVVIDRSPRSIIAQRIDAGNPAAQASPYPFTRLSPTARLIGSLLPAEGEAAPAAPLNRGQPLINASLPEQAPAARLAATLAEAVTKSGVFFEAHQAEWVKGKLPLAELLQEPQGRWSSPSAFVDAAMEKVGAGETAATPPDTAAASRQGASQPSTATAGSVPEELRPIVQQQLEAAASQRILWHGEVWPQQAMDWMIEWEDRQGGGSEGEEEGITWHTRLTLTTPRLGRIEARLQLTSQGVRLAIQADEVDSAARLRAAMPTLAAALERAGVPLLQWTVER